MTNAADSALSIPRGSLELPHRLVMAPMTRNRAAADGTPTRSWRPTTHSARARA
ncbi:hypothetical protein [Nocardia abscessus]|uniref:hypothetical protein n=1 Tax=Nocardia abscessus TaxID=120957 RepID=UPI001E52A755|nr:hypothetical protein [Nocardia abscessus]